MRIVFLGTPKFSVTVLNDIYNSSHQIVGVVTQIDRANKRGNKIVYSEVKQFAIDKNLPLYQFANINNNVDTLKKLNADIMVTAAYGQILKNDVLKLCKHGVINVHASLLPKYRGASPVQWALINGEKVIGTTIMQTALGIDSGDIIVSKEITLDGYENSQQALDKLADLGGKLVVEALDLIESGKATFTPQNHEEATHCGMLKKEDGKINFNKTAEEISNFIRGMTPWPSAFCVYSGKTVKILQAEVYKGSYNDTAQIGEIVASSQELGVVIKCQSGYIKILKIQSENGKAMDIRSYLLGNKMPVGSVFA